MARASRGRRGTSSSAARPARACGRSPSASSADLVVFGSDWHTAPGHVQPGQSALRLIEGGPVSVAIAAAGLRNRTDAGLRTVALAGGEVDDAARATAEGLAALAGDPLALPSQEGLDLLVVGSRPGTADGRVDISAAAEYLVETATSSVLIVARGVVFDVERAAARDGSEDPLTHAPGAVRRAPPFRERPATPGVRRCGIVIGRSTSRSRDPGRPQPRQAPSSLSADPAARERSDAMETWDAIRARRNVRSFTDEPIAPEQLDQILEAARRTPSSRNWQPWDFVVVTDREQLRRLATVWVGAGHVAGSAATIALIAPLHDGAREQELVQYDLGQATMSIAIAAADLGIGSGHSAVGDQELARRAARHPADHFCAFLIALGHPADRPLAPLTPDRSPAVRRGRPPRQLVAARRTSARATVTGRPTRRGERMELHPEALAFLEAVHAAGGPPLDELTAAEAREVRRRVRRADRRRARRSRRSRTCASR